MATMKSRLAAGTCGAAIALMAAGPALAGEVTGSGKNFDQNQGKSWCSFSGLNDDLRSLFELTKLDTLFAITETPEQALASF